MSSPPLSRVVSMNPTFYFLTYNTTVLFYTDIKTITKNIIFNKYVFVILISVNSMRISDEIKLTF